MRQLFTIIQGGLSDEAEARPAPGAATRAAGWRIALRRANSLDAGEIAAWRSLVARQPSLDPFADPDFLVTAARHAAGGREIVFALAFAEQEQGEAILAGVLPLRLPHPVWGGAKYRLWHPGLAPRPVEPVFDAAIAAEGIEAVLRHLAASRPRAGLHLSGLAGEGTLLDSLSADDRLDVVIAGGRAEQPIPATQFVAITARQPDMVVETIEGEPGLREAVERFLLLDARFSPRPLLSDPAAAATIRVATRLLARRGLVGVEFGSRDGEIVSGAIRLGVGSRRVSWRAVNRAEPSTAADDRIDVVVGLATPARRQARSTALKLVAS